METWRKWKCVLWGLVCAIGLAFAISIAFHSNEATHLKAHGFYLPASAKDYQMISSVPMLARIIKRNQDEGILSVFTIPASDLSILTQSLSIRGVYSAATNSADPFQNGWGPWGQVGCAIPSNREFRRFRKSWTLPAKPFEKLSAHRGPAIRYVLNCGRLTEAIL